MPSVRSVTQPIAETHREDGREKDFKPPQHCRGPTAIFLLSPAGQWATVGMGAFRRGVNSSPLAAPELALSRSVQPQPCLGILSHLGQVYMPQGHRAQISSRGSDMLGGQGADREA